MEGKERLEDISELEWRRAFIGGMLSGCDQIERGLRKSLDSARGSSNKGKTSPNRWHVLLLFTLESRLQQPPWQCLLRWNNKRFQESSPSLSLPDPMTFHTRQEGYGHARFGNAANGLILAHLHSPPTMFVLSNDRCNPLPSKENDENYFSCTADTLRESILPTKMISSNLKTLKVAAIEPIIKFVVYTT